MTKHVVTLRMNDDAVKDPCSTCESGCVCDPATCPCLATIASEKPKSSWYWLRDAGGYPSVSITMLAISFWVTTVVYALSIIHKIGPFEMRDFNVGASGAYFGLILTTYVARRFTDAKYGNPNVTTQSDVGPLAGMKRN